MDWQDSINFLILPKITEIFLHMTSIHLSGKFQIIQTSRPGLQRIYVHRYANRIGVFLESIVCWAYNTRPKHASDSKNEIRFDFSGSNRICPSEQQLRMQFKFRAAGHKDRTILESRKIKVRMRRTPHIPWKSANVKSISIKIRKKTGTEDLWSNYR